MTQTPSNPLSPQKREDGKRLLAFVLAMGFILQFIATMMSFWRLKRPLNLLGLQKSVSTWQVERELNEKSLEQTNALNPIEKKSPQELQEEASAITVSQAINAQQATKSGLVPTFQEINNLRKTKIAPMLNQQELEETQLAKVQQKNKNLNIEARYQDAVEQIALSRSLENVITDSEFLLPWETDLETGTVYWQSAKLNLPSNFLELSVPSEEEIAQYYARNIDSLYRTPNSCRLKLLESNFDRYHPESEPTEAELKEFFRENPERFVRPAQRCFRYVEVGDVQLDKNSQFKSSDTLSKKDFYQRKPSIDVCARKDLPSDFAQVLFKLKPRQMAHGLVYNGKNCTIEHLFEIPEKKLSFAEARPLVLMHQFEKAKQVLSQDLMRELCNSLPLEGADLKLKLDAIFKKYGFKPKWKIKAKKTTIYNVASSLKQAGMNDKTVQSLTASPLQDGEVDPNVVRYGCIKKTACLPTVIELSKFSGGQIKPIIEVKESIARTLKNEANNQMAEEEILKQVAQILAKEKGSELASEDRGNENVALSDDLDFGEEQRIEVRPVSLQLAAIEAEKKKRWARIFRNDETLQKMDAILAVLPPPQISNPTYALLPPEYDSDGAWQLIRCSKRAKLPKSFSDLTQSEEANTEVKTRQALLAQMKHQQAQLLSYHLLSGSLESEQEELRVLDKAVDELQENILSLRAQ